MARVVTWGATEQQYEVRCADPTTGEDIEEYTAGNHYGSSQDYVPPGTRHAATLEQMREWAESTAREMAEEYNAEYGGEDEDTTEGIKELYQAIEEGRI